MDVRALWAQVPPVACRGLCGQTACTNVVPKPAERAEHARVGVSVSFDESTGNCANLADGRCTIYEDRPLVCRLWGAVPEMPCPHGCQPTLTSAEGMILMFRAALLGRGNEG